MEDIKADSHKDLSKIEKIELSLDEFNKITMELRSFAHKMIDNSVPDQEKESLPKLRSLSQLIDELPDDINKNRDMMCAVLKDLTEAFFI